MILVRHDLDTEVAVVVELREVWIDRVPDLAVVLRFTFSYSTSATNSLNHLLPRVSHRLEAIIALVVRLVPDTGTFDLAASRAALLLIDLDSETAEALGTNSL